MNIKISNTRPDNGWVAAEYGAQLLRDVLKKNGKASIILATGASQFEMLETLCKAGGIDWHKVTIFHLDEYVGLPIEHPASFRGYLWKRFVAHLPVPLAAFHYVEGDAPDAEAECKRLSELIKAHSIDIAFIGIGENGHIAFNDPPADFDTDEPFLVVNLDDKCRQQQLGEGWFPDFESVPSRAITMSIRRIMMSKVIICTVPDERKAEAVAGAVDGPLTNLVPASILRTHPDCTLFLDKPAASLLK
jgi:glucosamine-6-phosphate deaminase